MIRRVGVFVALVAMAATASAQAETKAEPKKTAPAKKQAPSKKAPAKPAEPAPEQTDGSGEAAEPDQPPTLEQIEAQLPPHQTGPKLVDLGNNIEIDLPANMILFEHGEAKALLEKYGEDGDNVNAIILKRDGLTQEANWAFLIEYDDVGYVTDDDADELDADELLSSYKKGTEEQNVQRKAKGIPDLFVDGWRERPQYHKASHQLSWGLNMHDTEGPTINFFTRVLGRNGYMSINLIDSPDRIDASKVETAALVNATHFKKGFGYEDHSSGDKSSGMGLRALVIGGTGLAVLKVAKTGLLIKLLLVFKKLFILVFAAIGGFFKWLFGRGKKNETVSYETPPTDDSGSAT